MAGGPGPPPPQPDRLGADGLDHQEALRPDRPLPPDAWRSATRPGASAPRACHSIPTTPSCSFRKAVLHRTAGQPHEAESCWRRILTLRRPEQFCSVDQGIYGHLTLRNLAALAEERGDRAEAVSLWRKVLAECPNDAEPVRAFQRLDKIRL